MKKVIFVAALAGVLTACGTTGPQPTAQQKMDFQQAKASFNSIPDWFTETPKEDGAVYAVGDAVSSSASGALSVARTNAFEGICQSVGGKVRSQTKVYRVDTEKSSTSTSTTAIRNFCPDVDVTGAQVVKSHLMLEGTRTHAYVMVKLPIGDANVLARTKQQVQQERQNNSNMKEEFKELDSIAGPKGESKVEVTPIPAPAVQTSQNELKLFEVDNAEYKKRRDEALLKPGAVVGQVTVQ